MLEGFEEIATQNKGKRIAIFTHGASMSFLLMHWCELVKVEENKHRCFKFKDKIVYDGIYDMPEVFKLILDKNNNVTSIENLKFDNL